MFANPPPDVLNPNVQYVVNIDTNWAYPVLQTWCPGPPWLTCVNAAATIERSGERGDASLQQLPSTLIPPPAPVLSTPKSSKS